jgi:rhamnogalacturonan endolyase
MVLASLFSRFRLARAPAPLALVVLLLLAGTRGPQAADGERQLFADDFSHFPPGWLTNPVGTLNGAIQEYHYLPNRGVPLAPWENAICHLDAWLIGDEEGTPYLEQHTVHPLPELSTPMFMTGDPEWHDYRVEVRVKPLALNEPVGLVFRYHTNRHYYILALSGGNTARLLVRLPLEKQLRIAEWRELAKVSFPYDTLRYYTLAVTNEGPQIRAFIDGKQILDAKDEELLKGKVGVAASVPARFQQFRVTVTPAVERDIQQKMAARDAELVKLRAGNPQPKLWKKFSVKGFGAGRNVRLGDLDGDGQLDMLIVQNIPRVRGDAFDAISAMTAVTLDGKVLWQIGKPDNRNALLTNDTPFQIHDVDGDGREDVVMVKDFQIQILDGRTGTRKAAAPMPPMESDRKDRPYQIHNGDSIAFVNVSGDPARRDILIKNRYDAFWVFNNKLQLLWKGTGQTGHFPFPADVDGDGKDEIFIGYAKWKADGTQVWSHDTDLKDHADGVMVANLSADPHAKPRAYYSGSDEGFFIIDDQGKLLKQVRIGHAQSPSAAKYRPDLPGLQYMTVNFWKNPGIITLFDAEGTMLAQEEPIHTATALLPVNWRGDGQEFAMLSANITDGGLIDGHLRRVVMFPKDGHPDLAYLIANVTGDARDEIIVWDVNEVWIYTQDRPVSGPRVYAPVRNPRYNDSNYLAMLSMPHWVEAGKPATASSSSSSADSQRRP